MSNRQSEIESLLASATPSVESSIATVRVRQFEYDQYGFTAGYDATVNDRDYMLVELWWSLSVKPGLLMTEESQYLTEDAAYRDRVKGKYRNFVEIGKLSGQVLRFLCIARLKKPKDTELVSVYGQEFVTVA